MLPWGQHRGFLLELSRQHPTPPAITVPTASYSNLAALRLCMFLGLKGCVPQAW